MNRKIAFRRSVFAATVLSLLVAVVLVAPIATFEYEVWLDRRVIPVEPDDQETADILRAAIAERFFEPAPRFPNPPKRHPIVYVLESASICASTRAEGDPCGMHTDSDHLVGVLFESRIPARFRRALVEANRQTQTLPRVASAWILPATAERFEDPAGPDASWAEFFEAYPGTAGFVRVALPVLSPDRTRAILYFEHFCGNHCARGVLVSLQHDASGWRVLEEELVWVA